jgi:four helix bundle protein
MSNDEENSPAQRGKPKFDLEERTACYGEAVIRFAKTLPKDVVNSPLISQLVRAATSIGANYCEADDAVSKKDFRHKIGTCKKEARETKHWLRMIVAAEPKVNFRREFCGRRPKNFISFLPLFCERTKDASVEF